MPATVPSPSRAGSAHPLLAYDSASAIAAYRGACPVTAARLLADILRMAEAMPDRGHVLNACSDRYDFAVTICAAIVRRQVTLLPPSTTPPMIDAMRAFAPDAYFVSDDPGASLDLPRMQVPRAHDVQPRAFDVPHIAADQLVALVFTSGSTGEPRPHPKLWGDLVLDAGLEATRLAIGPGHTILGTVPPQHMYGFESTVLLPLLSGAALTGERLYLPASIDAAIHATAAPRTMFITPFHLRTWLEGGEPARIETLVSATAPLSAALAREAEERTGARLFEIYGCTEAGQVATRRTAQTAEWHAFDGIRLWTENGHAMVAGGHVAQPTALMDVIEVVGDGSRFLLHGRTADLVNIAGKRNSLGYLDHQLLSIPGVTDAAFYLPDDEELDGVTRLMAFAVAPTLDAAAILANLRGRIDAAFLPRPLVLVDRLPRAISGKLPREQLRLLAQPHRRTGK